MNEAAIVFLVDDDESVRSALLRLLKSAGYRARAFASAQALLAEPPPDDAPVVVLTDLRMPGIDGIELAEKLSAYPVPPPIVFLSAHGDVQPGREPPAPRAGGPDRELREAHAPRAPGFRAGDLGPDQQGSGLGAGNFREDDQGASRPRGREDGRPVAAGSGPNGRTTRTPVRAPGGDHGRPGGIGPKANVREPSAPVKVRPEDCGMRPGARAVKTIFALLA